MLVPYAVLTVRNHSILFISAICLELEAHMIAAFSGKEQKASIENINARAGCHSVKKLNLHSVHILIRKDKHQLVQVAILTLKHEEESLVVEDSM